jgi:hypothetical protein
MRAVVIAALAALALSACSGSQPKAEAEVTTTVAATTTTDTPVSTTLPPTTTVDDGVPDEVQAAEVALGQPPLTAKRYADYKAQCDAIAAGEPDAMLRVNQALPWQLGNVIWNLLPVCHGTVSDMLDGLQAAGTTTTAPPTTTTLPPTTTTLPSAPIVTEPSGTVVITYDGPDEAGAMEFIDTLVASMQPDLAGLCPLLQTQPDLVREGIRSGFDDPLMYEAATRYGYTHPLAQAKFIDMAVIAYSNRIVRECG